MIYEDKNGKAVVAGILSIVPPDCLNPPSDLITTNVYNFYGTVVPCSSATPFYAIFAATSFFTFFFFRESLYSKQYSMCVSFQI